MQGPPQKHTPYSAKEYFELAEVGIISPDEKAELLDGIVVAMSPQSPRHAACVYRATRTLVDAVPQATIVRTQMPFLAADRSVPEPDIAVVPGEESDYETAHLRRAYLVIEVAEATLAQDRLTKATIYARAAVPQYWILNLRDGVVEWFREPDRWNASYRQTGRATAGQGLQIEAFPGVSVQVSRLLPSL